MITESRRRFYSTVEDHLKYKPDYPRKLIDFLYDECGFSWESVIADMGSGTGTFTRLLLERGSRVVAIEPDRALREAAERILGDEFPRFFSLEATAENTTLSDGSVHHIVCAQSFHFFDAEKCRQEFSRILRPGGLVVLIAMLPSQRDEFSSECARLVARYSEKISQNLAKDISGIYKGFFRDLPYSALSVSSRLTLDFESFCGRLFTSFPLPGPDDDCFDDMMEEMEILFELYQQQGTVTYVYDSVAYAGKLENAC
jgi:Methyltransferase domain.